MRLIGRGKFILIDYACMWVWDVLRFWVIDKGSCGWFRNNFYINILIV